MRFLWPNASDQETELIALRAATLARAEEMDAGDFSSAGAVARWVKFAADEMKRKLDRSAATIAATSAAALLAERAFLNEFMAFQVQNPGQPIPAHFRPKMLAAVQRMVSEFRASR